MDELRGLEDLSVRQLRLFVRVVELASFSGAAREAQLSQPAASRTVAALEARVGAPLLTRTHRRVTATALGERLAKQLKPLLEAFSALEGEAAPDGLQGVLRVAAPSAFGRAFVVPAMNTFLRANPRVELALELSDRRVDLVERRIDVAFRLGAAPAGARARTIGSSEALVVCAPSLAAGVASKGLDELLELPAVVHGSGARALGISPKRLRVRLECDDLDAAFEAAVAGLGVTVLPRWRCQAALDTGALVRLLPSLSLPRVPVRAVFPGHRRPGRLARAFVDGVVRTLPGPLMP